MNNNSAADLFQAVGTFDSGGSSAATSEAAADTSSALVRGCFTGLGLVHFAVALWTRPWVLQLVLAVGVLGFVGYAVTRLRLVERAKWLIANMPTTASQTPESEEDSLTNRLVPGTLRSACYWALCIERHVSYFGRV